MGGGASLPYYIAVNSFTIDSIDNSRVNLERYLSEFPILVQINRENAHQ